MEARRASSLVEGYAYYKENTDNPVSKVTYKKILTRLFELMLSDLITKAVRLILPARLGAIFIFKKILSADRSLVDYAATKQVYGEYNEGKPPSERKVIKHKNKHTDGYTVKVGWSKRALSNFANKSKWSFKFCRPNIRPNTYNKNNPAVSLVPFIKQFGVDIYPEYTKQINNA